MANEDYLLDNRGTETGGRFGALSDVFDPVTFRHLDALGPATGWRCWEVGAGGPSVPDGLAQRVGPTGTVVATDIDIGWLTDRVGPGVEVIRHDVARDEPPGDGFDLIHARLVLLHIPEREQALTCSGASATRRISSRVVAGHQSGQYSATATLAHGAAAPCTPTSGRCRSPTSPTPTRSTPTRSS